MNLGQVGEEEVGGGRLVGRGAGGAGGALEEAGHRKVESDSGEFGQQLPDRLQTGQQYNIHLLTKQIEAQ